MVPADGVSGLRDQGMPSWQGRVLNRPIGFPIECKGRFQRRICSFRSEGSVKGGRKKRTGESVAGLIAGRMLIIRYIKFDFKLCRPASISPGWTVSGRYLKSRAADTAVAANI